MCDCVYRAMYQLKQESRRLTREARQAWRRGETGAVNGSLIGAFRVSARLLELPVVQPDGVYCFVNACFNCVQYCEYSDAGFAVRKLELAAGALRNLVDWVSGCKTTRRAALDSYLLVSRALVREWVGLNGVGEAREVSKRCERVWRKYGHDLIPLH